MSGSRIFRNPAWDLNNVDNKSEVELHRNIGGVGYRYSGTEPILCPEDANFVSIEGPYNRLIDIDSWVLSTRRNGIGGHLMIFQRSNNYTSTIVCTEAIVVGPSTIASLTEVMIHYVNDGGVLYVFVRQV